MLEYFIEANISRFSKLYYPLDLLHMYVYNVNFVHIPSTCSCVCEIHTVCVVGMTLDWSREDYIRGRDDGHLTV